MNATIQKLARALRRDQRGLTTVEYAIVLCLIAAVGVTAWQKFGKNVNTYIGNATNAIDSEMKKQPSH